MGELAEPDDRLEYEASACGDVRGGAKRADSKGGALNNAWVPTENT